MARFLINFLSFLVLVGSLVCYLFWRLGENFSESPLASLDGLFTEIIGGLIFITILIIILKPSVRICKNIASIPKTGEIEKHLRFKIVNTSIFNAQDLQIRIFHKERTHGSGADITSTLIAAFEGYEFGVSYLQGGFISFFQDTKTNAAQFRFHKIIEDSDETITKILDSPNSYLEIHVNVRNGLSGLQGNFIRKFFNPVNMKEGYYRHGFYTDIIK